MNKSELIQAIADEAELSKRDAAEFVDAFVSVVTQTLKDGKDITLVGFGSFHTSQSAERKGRNSPAKASDIVNALGRVGGVSKQFGLTELQTASLANTFISLGKSPEVAGTAINGMLTKLMTADKQGKKFQATLQMMGLESKDLKKAISENGEQALQDFLKTLNKLPKEQQMGALVDLFGLEYADDIAVLAGNVDLYEKSIRALKDTGKDGKLSFEGSMSKEFAARSETTAANWEIFKNSLKELGIVIGSTLLPAINSLMSSIAPIIHSISDWAAANPTLTRTLIGFIGGLALFKTTLLGGMFIVNIFRTGILQITGLFMRLGMLLMANPIGIAIGLLAVAAYLLYDNWSAVVGGAKALKERAKRSLMLVPMPNWLTHKTINVPETSPCSATRCWLQGKPLG